MFELFFFSDLKYIDVIFQINVVYNLKISIFLFFSDSEIIGTDDSFNVINFKHFFTTEYIIYTYLHLKLN